MSSSVEKRNYRLDGPENKRAQEKGLAGANWYKSPISQERLKQLSRRKDAPAIRDTLIAIVVLAALGALACLAWGTWWAVPAFAVYGIVYASLGDSRWHECLHGTAFKTPWMNKAIYQAASFMILRQATPWRWSHYRHHRDTIIVGRDPEIPLRPKAVKRSLIVEILELFASAKELSRLGLHCLGRLDKEEMDYIPMQKLGQVILEARVYILIFLSVIALCFHSGNLMPALLIGLPSFYGLALVLLTGVLQHVGLPEDVLDHRLNSRTVYMNPILRFLYWNMNYHLDHHMYPSVPYHALPALHEEIKHDCPVPKRGMISGIREVLAAMKKQREDPTYVLVRPLPETAQPYQFGLKDDQEQAQQKIRSIL